MAKLNEENIKIRKKTGSPPKNKMEKELQIKIENEILAFISDNNLSLRKSCKKVGISPSTFINWCSKSKTLKDKYEMACNERLEGMFEDILEIADNTEKGQTVKTLADGGSEITESDMLQHRKLKIDARKWYLSKVAPKKYGDKIEVDQKIEGNLDVNVVETVQIYLPDNGRDK